MAGRLLKHMGVDKALAEDVNEIIQGNAEVRRNKEKQLRLEMHKEHQERQQAEKTERRRERAVRHRALLEQHRKKAARRRKRRQAVQPLSSLPECQDPQTAPQA